jgi:hypothetical protein
MAISFSIKHEFGGAPSGDHESPSVIGLLEKDQLRAPPD